MLPLEKNFFFFPKNWEGVLVEQNLLVAGG
jgi:hypothetical protein